MLLLILLCYTKQKVRKPSLTYFGTSDKPSAEPVIAYDADGRLVAIEGDTALTIQQVKYSHCTILITYSNMDAIR